MRKINVAQVVDESKFNSLHLGVVAWCAFIMLCDGYDMIVFGSVIPSISVEWGITTSTAGAIGSLAMFGSLIGSLVCGILADFLGRKRVIIFCFIIFSFFTFLTGFAQGPVDFTIYRFIGGLGLGGMPPLLIAITSEYAPKPSRSMLVGLISSGFAIGGIGVALLGIFIIPRFGWEWMFFIGGLPLIAVPFMIKYMPESLAFLVVRKDNEKVSSILKRLNPLYIPKKDDSFEVYLPKAGMPVAKLFDERRGFSTIMFWITSFMALLVIYGLGTWLPQLMVQAGYPLTSSLLFLFALNIGVMVGNITGGLLADRKAPKKVIAGMLILGAISLSLLGLKPGTIILYLLVAIAGACSNGPGTTNYGYASKFYPTHIRSTGVGWTSGIGRIGAMLGPAFGGLLLELSLPTHMNFISFAIPALLGALAISFVQDKYSDFNMIANKPVQQFGKQQVNLK
ncbi:AAHS family benzoate transporter-like MFS transporter [Neobacillus niacini]|uniref:MFS transporter n=1 Tax=Neobacillus niacini TaxID=86668 RepID=UPI001044AC39|nr:aromatic acid/H+ symport family MFS transporter [Neobacillus niacini]MDR7075956.1 AAHS family benzoate transporter-like MFS transporter [Neobacillus niacini]